MITCVLHYTINPAQIDAFERFAREWMRLVAKHGGIHHGYFLPSEGASDRAEALFSFESLAAYEVYRSRFGKDPEFVAADKIRDDSGCVLRYERTFMRPLLSAQLPSRPRRLRLPSSPAGASPPAVAVIASRCVAAFWSPPTCPRRSAVPSASPVSSSWP